MADDQLLVCTRGCRDEDHCQGPGAACRLVATDVEGGSTLVGAGFALSLLRLWSRIGPSPISSAGGRPTGAVGR